MQIADTNRSCKGNHHGIDLSLNFAMSDTVRRAAQPVHGEDRSGLKLHIRIALTSMMAQARVELLEEKKTGIQGSPYQSF